MQLCIEIISFINNENESLLRWFYSLCESRNFSLCPRSVVRECQSKKVCSCDFYDSMIYMWWSHVASLWPLIFITRPKSDSFLPALDLLISILVLNVASRSVFRLYSDGLELGIWFTTSCCCLVEFGSSCFNHALIKSWFVWFGPWYTTDVKSMNHKLFELARKWRVSAQCF